MNPKSSKTFWDTLENIDTETLMIFCNDCMQSALAICHENIHVLTVLGMDLTHISQESLEGITSVCEHLHTEEVILVGHYPCGVHQHLLHEKKPSCRHKELSEGLIDDFLALGKEGLKELTDKDRSLIHLQRQVHFLQGILESRATEEHPAPKVKTLILTKEQEVIDLEPYDMVCRLN